MVPKWGRIWESWQRLSRSTAIQRLAWWAVFFGITVALLSLNWLPSSVGLEVGQRSPRDFYAPQGMVFVSDILTAREKQKAQEAIEPVYTLDNSAAVEAENQVASLFQNLRAVRSSTGNTAAKLQDLNNSTGLNLSDRSGRVVLSLSDQAVGDLENDLKAMVRRTMAGGVQQQGLNAARQNMLEEAESLSSNPGVQEFCGAVIKSLRLRPNLIYDAAATRQKQIEAANKIAPVQVTVRQGEKVLGVGDLVTDVHIETLRHLGLLRSGFSFLGLLGIVLLSAITYALLWVYLYQNHRSIYQRLPHLLLLGLIIVVTLAVAKGLTSISLGGQAGLSTLTGYLAPTAAGSMLIAILLDARIAVVSTLAMGIFLGVMTGNQLNFALVGIVGGLVGVYSVSRLSQRLDLARASLFIMAANAITVIAIGLVANVTFSYISIGGAMALLNGILSSVLTIGILPFLETAFNITSAVKLLELSNPNQPLLRQLLVEAPGTYHHSILVGNLAEAAANAVKADALLARVGAYYHDIGKIKRPYFFIENQFAGENPHDKLTPSLSTLIITTHVKDGVEMAKENRLPQVIIDFIEQHHGTSLVSYFYSKAVEADRTESVSDTEYRYEGVKPKSKETAIVMLADSVEAGVRALQKPTPGRMEGLVRRIIKEKLEDGQLEESDLTFKELDAIAQAFLRILTGVFHTRIEYPDTVLKEMERRKASGGAVRAKPAG